jgi:cardiolipin synthase
VIVQTSASAFAPLWNRQAEWNRRLDMVRAARTFLYQSLFYIEYDAYGRQMLAALLEAQKRGVRVQLIIDHFGQRLGGVLMNRSERAALDRAIGELRREGALVIFYRPARFMQRRLAGGHHVKIQASEQGEAILSSGNITKSSFEGWNEYAMAVRGAVAPVLVESLRLIGGQVSDDHLEVLHDLARADPGDLPLEYWFCNPNLHQGMFGALGWRGPNALTDKMIEMVDAARRSLLITSFYFKPTESLMAAVLRAARRGVHVEVHHSHRDALPATDLAWIAAAVSYKRLHEAGVLLYENRHGEHSKIVLVDDEWAACGSYNFEDAAHDRLAEAMLASRDHRVIAPAVAIFDGLRRDPDNQRVTGDDLRQWPDAVRQRVARYGRFKRWM